MAVIVSVDTTHYSCVVPGPKTTTLITILIARYIFFLSWVMEKLEEEKRLEAVWAVEVVSYRSDSDKWNLPSESGKKLYLCCRKCVTLPVKGESHL